MRTLTLLTILAFGAAAPLAAMDADMHHPAGTSPTINSECPMCGKAVGDKPSTVKVTVGEGAEAKSYLIACESKDCSDAFMKDPEPVMRKTFGKGSPGPKTLYK